MSRAVVTSIAINSKSVGSAGYIKQQFSSILFFSNKGFMMKTNKLSSFTVSIIMVCCALTVQAKNPLDNQVDKNIEILFPTDYFKQQVLPLIPQIMQGVQLSSDKEREEVNIIIDKMLVEYCNNIDKNIKASIKKNFTPEEIAEWVKYGQSPLGIKTSEWVSKDLQPMISDSIKAPLAQALQEIRGNIVKKD